MSKITEIEIGGAVHQVSAQAQNIPYGEDGNVKDALDNILSGETIERNLTSRNIFDKDSATKNSAGNYVVNAQGEVVAQGGSGTKVYTTPVEAGQTYCYKLASHGALTGVHQYDAQGNYLGKVDQYVCDEGGRCFTVADNAAVMRVVYLASLANSLMIERGEVVHEYEPYNDKYLAGVNGNYVGAEYPAPANMHLPYNIAFLGDSIMSEVDGKWYVRLTQKYGCKWSKNYGVGGAVFTHSASTIKTTVVAAGANNNISNQAYRLIVDHENGNAPEPDIVVISAGTNDRGGGWWNDDSSTGKAKDQPNDLLPSGLPKEEVTDWTILAAWDDQDTREMYGADPYTMRQYDHYHGGSSSIPRVNYADLYDPIDGDPDFSNAALRSMGAGCRMAVEMLRRAFPACVVVICIPIYNSYNSYFRQRHVQRNLRIIADYLSCPIIDVAAECGIAANMGTQLLGDGLHPNRLGANRIADVVGHALLAKFGHIKLIDYHVYTVSGTTVDSNGNALGNALVTLASPSDGTDYNTRLTIESDSNGAFSVNLPVGWYKMNQSSHSSYSSLGYLDVKGNMSNVTIRLNYTPS